jgi:hypothetical protein
MKLYGCGGKHHLQKSSMAMGHKKKFKKQFTQISGRAVH